MARGSCASTSAPRPASARPSRCSTRARRRHERGTDVVVGFVETHGRPSTAEQIARPRGRPAQRRSSTAARRSRRWTSTRSSPATPEVALVDELAHTNVPGLAQREALAGRRGAARRRDRRDLHGEHPAPRVASTTSSSASPASRQQRDDPRRRGPRGRADRARRHDARGAAAPHGARQHLPGRADRRRARRTTSGPATSPRCASSRCCGSPTGSTSRSSEYREAHGITEPWETRERVVVALTGAPDGETLDPAGRAHGAARADGDLVGVHVRADDGLRPTAGRASLEQHRQLLEELGGSYHEVVGDDVGDGARDGSPGGSAPPSSCSARAGRSRWDGARCAAR